MKNKTITTIVIFFFIFVFLIFYKGLNNSNIYKPSNNENKIIPKFSAYSFFENKLINSENIFNQKKFYLLNIWASWCVPCRNEHDTLMQLSQNDSIKIIGLNYKDNLDNAKKFINEIGNPYSNILRDQDGTISIELGAYGVPETLVIDNNKIILKKFVGPLNNQSLKEIKSLIR